MTSRMLWHADCNPALDVSHSNTAHMTTTPQLHGRALMFHSSLELMVTAVLLFGVTTIVRFAVEPSAISRAFPQIHVELVIVGVMVAVLLAGLIITRPGRISGGHMNPAIIACHVALWCVPRSWRGPLHRSSASQD
jgi:hypothetical protein